MPPPSPPDVDDTKSSADRSQVASSDENRSVGAVVRRSAPGSAPIPTKKPRGAFERLLPSRHPPTPSGHRDREDNFANASSEKEARERGTRPTGSGPVRTLDAARLQDTEQERSAGWDRQVTEPSFTAVDTKNFRPRARPLPSFPPTKSSAGAATAGDGETEPAAQLPDPAGDDGVAVSDAPDYEIQEENVDTVARGRSGSSAAPPSACETATPRRSPVPVPMRLPSPRQRVVGDGPLGPDPERLRVMRKASQSGGKPTASRPSISSAAGGATGTLKEPHRSHSTQAQYLRKGGSLLNRYRLENNLEDAMDDIDPVEVVNWLLARKATLKQSTWRFYRLSAVAVLDGLPHERTETALGILDADINENLSDAQSGNITRRSLPKRTSAKKTKHFPKEDFDKLLKYLRYHRKGKTPEILMDWLVASIWTGLRPIEWRGTSLEVWEDVMAPSGRRAWLYVLNAKATNGRGNGEMRTLDVTHFSDPVLAAISKTSLRGSRWFAEGRYHHLQGNCSRLLYQSCRVVFPKRQSVYCLYSCRHQFVANMKSILRPEELSALVGHGVTDTAQEHYGRRRSAWSPDQITERPAAIPREIAMVRQRMSYSEKRLRTYEEVGLQPPWIKRGG